MQFKAPIHLWYKKSVSPKDDGQSKYTFQKKLEKFQNDIIKLAVIPKCNCALLCISLHVQKENHNKIKGGDCFIWIHKLFFLMPQTLIVD